MGLKAKAIPHAAMTKKSVPAPAAALPSVGRRGANYRHGALDQDSESPYCQGADCAQHLETRSLCRVTRNLVYWQLCFLWCHTTNPRSALQILFREPVSLSVLLTVPPDDSKAAVSGDGSQRMPNAAYFRHISTPAPYADSRHTACWE